MSMTCEQCGETGHIDVNCPNAREDANIIGNSNNRFCPNQGFNSDWNKPKFPFDNRQQGGNGHNFNQNEPSLRDIIRDQLKINENISKEFLTNERS